MWARVDLAGAVATWAFAGSGVAFGAEAVAGGLILEGPVGHGVSAVESLESGGLPPAFLAEVGFVLDADTVELFAVTASVGAMFHGKLSGLG